MFRAPLIALGLILAIPAAGIAAEHGGKDEKAEVGQYVDISPVALPIVYQGRLINYVFVYVRLNLASNANAIALREKEPYFRDALVRVGHRTPFTRLDNFTVIDEPKLKAAIGAAAAQIVGPKVITSVVITSQSPKKQSGLPKPPNMPVRPGPQAAPHAG